MSAGAATDPRLPKLRLLGALITGAVFVLYALLAKSMAPRAPALRASPADIHGRSANWPSHIPKRGWWDILMRVKDGILNNNLFLIAAGAAFYAFLAIPSTITAVVSVYGLVSDPSAVQGQVQAMEGLMPSEAIKLISEQLTTITSHSGSTLGLGLIISLLIALWSARSGVSSMITALNIVYEEEEKRGFIAYYALAFTLTVATIILAIIALALVAVLPAIIGLLPFGTFGKTLTSLARWPILIGLIMVVLATLYRFAPSRREAKWRWVSWGAVAATAIWIAGSALFSIYVGQFAAYDKTYGSLGGVVILLMWLFVSAFAVLLGAELNAEIEHQTARDSTTGPEKPMGQRGAWMADTLGEDR